MYAYYPALDNSFTHWDDQYYITNNALITQPTWSTCKTLTTKIISLNFHPLTMMSLWLNSKIFGATTATSFIATNILFHILNTLLVYLFCMKLFSSEKITALICAMIFALHPLHVESVAWISERKDVLYCFFFFLSLLSYLSFKQNKNIFYFISLLFFILSCLSKAMAVSLVPVLYLIDWLQGDKLLSLKTHFTKLPFIALGILFGMIAIDVQSGGDFYGYLEISIAESAIPNYDYSFSQKINHLGYGITYYLKQFLLPSHFSALHPFSYVIKHGTSIVHLIIPAIFLLLLIWSIFKSKRITFGLGFFLSTIALVLQIIPVGSAIVAERYTYLPYIGLAIITGSLLQYLWSINAKAIVCILAMIISLAFTISTHNLVDVWQDHISLFQNVVEQYPTEPQPRSHLASGYWTAGQLDSAIHHIEYAINELEYVSSSAFQLLANCYADKGDTHKANAFYKEALRLDSTNVIARYHMAIWIMDSDPKQAIKEFDICEQSQNTYVADMIYMPRGRCYGFIGNFEKALENQHLAVEKFPNEIENYIDRAVTYENLRKWELAIDDYRKALSMDPEREFVIERLDVINKRSAVN